MSVKTATATYGTDESTVLAHLGCATREEAILKYYDLVKYTAYRLAARLPDNICVEDLFNAGVIGLMDAVSKYDPSQSVSFENYAKIRIRGAMLDEIRSMDWVPRSLRQKSAELEKTCSALEQRLGRFPEDEEIAEEMGISLEEYHQLLDSLKGISFIPEDLNEYIQENREAAHLATGPNELFDQIHRAELQEALASCIETLTEKEKLVLSLYYFEELTMKEVGAVMGYTESRISQIHTKAILKLRTRLAKKLTQEDLPEGLSLKKKDPRPSRTPRNRARR